MGSTVIFLGGIVVIACAMYKFWNEFGGGRGKAGHGGHGHGAHH